jgi:dTDP-glucose 4,6-dehydratase
MKVLITGEAGFIARNLEIAFNVAGHDIVYVNDANVLRLSKTGEVCVHRNSSDTWQWHMKNLDIDVVIHNAAVVGTDVVALNPNNATLTNVTGCYNLARAAKTAGIPICYMGTTVIYDTAKYQNKKITETSNIRPMTFYGSQKLAGEHIITSHSNDWMIIRPLFAYGGVGDMNSLIAKSIYTHLRKRGDIDMFLDPSKVKDYLHVQDFCEAVVVACSSGLWGNDYNIAAETPHITSEIVELMSEIVSPSIISNVRWHPKTDYLGNHMLDSEKFRSATGWLPKISLHDGIKKVLESIISCTNDYDPLVHLKQAKDEGVDLTNFYNSNINSV